MSITCILNSSKNSKERSVAVFPDAFVSVDVVGFWAFTLDAGTIHESNAVQLVVGVTPATQARLEKHEKREK